MSIFELLDNISKLQNELNETSFDNIQKDQIIKCYMSWVNTTNKKVIIENKQDIIIHINQYGDIIEKNIYSDTHDMLQFEELYDFSSIKYTTKIIASNVYIGSNIIFSNCNKVLIIVDKPIANITIERCDNIKIYVNNKMIKGIDCIKCNDVYMSFRNQIPFIEIGDSVNINVSINSKYALNCTIHTIRSRDTNFLVKSTKPIRYKSKYIINSILYKCIFEENNGIFDDITSLKKFVFLPKTTTDMHHIYYAQYVTAPVGFPLIKDISTTVYQPTTTEIIEELYDITLDHSNIQNNSYLSSSCSSSYDPHTISPPK